MSIPDEKKPALPALIAAFAVIYIIWGSTYLAIKFAVQTLPPFLMAGSRFAAAGLILYPVIRAAGASRPDGLQWRRAAVIGTLLLLGGNGLVSWAVQWVPSGASALIVGTTPLWIVLLDWLAYQGPRPRWTTVVGMFIGIIGIVLLVGAPELEMSSMPALAVPALLAACALWAWGTLESKRHGRPPSMLLASAMQMICGGAMLIAVGTISGEWSRANFDAVSTRSLVAFFYLVVIGSLVAFSTYVWLVRSASPAAVSTYAYVNPLVAVLLGWWLGNEPLGANVLTATGLIVGAVVLITLLGRRRPHQEPFEATMEEPQPTDEAAARPASPVQPASDR